LKHEKNIPMKKDFFRATGFGPQNKRTYLNGKKLGIAKISCNRRQRKKKLSKGGKGKVRGNKPRSGVTSQRGLERGERGPKSSPGGKKGSKKGRAGNQRQTFSLTVLVTEETPKEPVAKGGN